MTIAVFPSFRGVTVEIDTAKIIFESDGSSHDGFDVRILNHPVEGDVPYWHGLLFMEAELQAHEAMRQLPGAVLNIACDEDPDDDPDGEEIEVRKAA